MPAKGLAGINLGCDASTCCLAPPGFSTRSRQYRNPSPQLPLDTRRCWFGILERTLGYRIAAPPAQPLFRAMPRNLPPNEHILRSTMPNASPLAALPPHPGAHRLAGRAPWGVKSEIYAKGTPWQRACGHATARAAHDHHGAALGPSRLPGRPPRHRKRTRRVPRHSTGQVKRLPLGSQ